MAQYGKLWYRFDNLLSPVIRGMDSVEYMALLDQLCGCVRSIKVTMCSIHDPFIGELQPDAD